MEFDCDPEKARSNKLKHGVTFEEACEVLFDFLGITVPDTEHSESEEREKTIGHTTRRKVLVVIHTQRIGAVIRIMSARKATRQEVIDYEAEIKQRLEGRG